jgi:glutathione S-transferase
MCRELELDIEYHEVHFLGAEIKSAEFRKLNPNQRIPVIRDGDFVLWESMAINLYLARKHGGPIAAASLEEEALVWQWSFWVMTEIEKPALGVLLQRASLPPGSKEEKYFRERVPKDEAQEQASLAALERPLLVLDEQLAGREFLIAPRFTVADLNVASVLAWAKMARVDLGPYPNVAAWLDRCLTRPAYP